MAVLPNNDDDANRHFAWVRWLLRLWEIVSNTRLGRLIGLLFVVCGVVLAASKGEKDLREFVCRYIPSLGICKVAPVVPAALDPKLALPAVEIVVPTIALEPQSLTCDSACELLQRMTDFRAGYDLNRRGKITPEQERVADGTLVATMPRDDVESIDCEVAKGQYDLLPTSIKVEADVISIRVTGAAGADGLKYTHTCTAARTDLIGNPHLIGPNGASCSARTGRAQLAFFVAGFTLDCSKKAGACWRCNQNEPDTRETRRVLLAFTEQGDVLRWTRAFVRWTSNDNSDFDYCLERARDKDLPLGGQYYCPKIDHDFAVEWDSAQRTK